jgi:hypothetical protein
MNNKSNIMNNNNNGTNKNNNNSNNSQEGSARKNSKYCYYYYRAWLAQSVKQVRVNNVNLDDPDLFLVEECTCSFICIVTSLILTYPTNSFLFIVISL